MASGKACCAAGHYCQLHLQTVCRVWKLIPSFVEHFSKYHIGPRLRVRIGGDLPALFLLNCCRVPLLKARGIAGTSAAVASPTSANRTTTLVRKRETLRY